MPNFDIKIEKAKKPESGKEATPAKKDAKKGADNKKDAKDTKKPEAAKKEKVKKEETKVKPEAPKKWTLPELKFNFYDFKTEFVNSKDKAATLQSLYKKWEPEGLSIWYLQYQKFDASEGTQLHIVNNLLNGFMQRMGEKLRANSLGSFGVYGEPG